MQSVRKLVFGGAMVAAALTGGAIGASFLGSAGAQTPTTQPSTSTGGATTQAPATDPGQRPARDGSGAAKGPHQANGVTETLLTGNDAVKATAAAQAAVPGGTIERVETDADGDAFEVHMAKADGSQVTVKLDSNFVVTKTVNGRG